MMSKFKYLQNSFTYLDIIDWDDDYSVDVCDGWSWEISIYKNENKRKNILGIVESPDNVYKFIDYIKKMIEFDSEQWLIG